MPRSPRSKPPYASRFPLALRPPRRRPRSALLRLPLMRSGRHWCASNPLGPHVCARISASDTAKAPLPLLCRWPLGAAGGPPHICLFQPARRNPTGRSSRPGRTGHQRRARGSPPRVREHELSSHLNPVPRSASNHYLATHLKLSCKRAGKRRTLGSLVAWKWLTEVPNTSPNFSLSILSFARPEAAAVGSEPTVHGPALFSAATRRSSGAPMQDTDLRLHPELRYSGEPRQELTHVDRLTSPNAHTLGHCSWPFWLPAPIATAHNSRNLGIGLALQRSKVSHLNVIQVTAPQPPVSFAGARPGLRWEVPSSC